MRLKAFVALTLLAVTAAWSLAATTWQLSTRVSTAGGSLSVRGGAAQTSANGTVFKYYTTHANIPVAITANTGYSISALTLNGKSQTLPIPSPTTYQMGLGSYPTTTAQSVTVSFGVQQFSLQASAGPGGSVSPSGTATVSYGGSKSYIFTPGAGNKLISVSGLPSSGVTYSPALGSAGPITVTISNITTNLTITGQFVALTANAGAPQTVMVNDLATLTGTANPALGTSYSWQQTSGPVPVVLSDPSSQTTTFRSAVAGYYFFRLTATNSGATATASTSVTVTSSPATAADGRCQSCHTQLGVSRQPFVGWSSSRHRPQLVMCASCHIGADSGSHPGVMPTSTTCQGCHTNTADHPFPIGANPCMKCHDPHSTVGTMTPPPTGRHYNNMTSAGYPASYVTSRSTCKDCHYDSAANVSVRQQWAASAHGDVTDTPWTIYDFKTMSGCVQCHTTTGFIAYSTGTVTTAWGVAADKTKEALTCVGCHKSVPTGVVRSVAPVRPYADDDYANRNVGESNICMDCHSGTNSGQGITTRLNAVPPADFTNQPFLDPHNLAAGATLHGRGGYRFAGQTYSSYSTNSHRSVGIGDIRGTGTAGPCIACHKNSTNGHTFLPGVTDVCALCHGTSLTAAQLPVFRQEYLSALEVLRTELALRGFAYHADIPRFTATNWGNGRDGADTMGAAFNYALLRSESGGYAHHSAYAKQLLFDSIDFLHNGQVTGDVTGAVSALLGSGAISQQTADDVLAYKARNICASCHDPSGTGSHPAHLNDSFGCADCHNATATSGTALVPGTAAHLNSRIDVVVAAANNSGSASFAAGSCSGVTCHASGPVTWGNGPVSCESCHTGTLSVINGTAAPDKSLSLQSGHGKSGIGQSCLSCHDRAKRHLGGNGRLQDQLTGPLNSDCSWCHDNPAVVTDQRFRNMSTHFTKGGGASPCADCHDPHGTTNLSMIRTAIVGQPVTYTDRATGWVDTTTNLGLCQVCHTATAHYQAGVAETRHPATNCYGCHSHRTAGGAFRPKGSCDACHAYPPASGAASPLYGTMNNWTSARYQDYSGGGGAHLVAAHVAPTARADAGWANCTLCHAGGAGSSESHVMQLPVASHIANLTVSVDQRYRFSDRFIVYTGAKLADPPAQHATGSCFNVSCHMSPSPKWEEFGKITMACDSCHRMPPLDAADGQRDAATGAVKGSHEGHAGATAASCVKCHGTDAATYTVGHGDGTIPLAANINNSPKTGGAAYSRAFVNRTSIPPDTLGTCSSVNCHFESTTPAWGSARYSAPQDCEQCHGAAPATGSHPVAGSKHGVYYGTGAGSCVLCHPDHLAEAKPFSHATSAANRGIAVRFTAAPNSGGVYTGTVDDYLPSQTNAFGSCASLYCHSNGAGGAANVTPTWGATLDCTGCHKGSAASGAPMASGKHGAHVNNALVLGVNYGCAECHATTVAGDTTIATLARHVNGFADYSGAKAGKSYTAATGACATVYCHSDGKGSYRDLTATNWKSSATLDCRGCHGADAAPAFASVAGEPNYANEGTGAPRANSHRKHATSAADCGTCHAATVTGAGNLTGSGHTNGAIEVVFNPARVAAGIAWDGTGKTCTNVSCHSDGTSVVTGVAVGGSGTWGGSLACNSCHGFPPAYANGSPKANSHDKHNVGCNNCHAATTSDGTTITGGSHHANAFYNVSSGAGVSFTYTYSAGGGTCSTISCHGNGAATWGVPLNCDGCHDAPPATASHLKHYGGTVAQAAYGDTSIAQDFGANGTTYIFGCGNCHPQDLSKHGNGVVDVEFYNATAPDGSVKKLNPPTASYTQGSVVADSKGYPYSNGTCNNVYCHSYRSWSTRSPVANSTTCTPAIPADLVTTRNYKPVTWGGASLDCAGCHENPPRTRYPDNTAGAGDSHSWISQYDAFLGDSFEFLHMNNMYRESYSTPYPDPISCMYCHNSTVKQKNTNTWDFLDPAVPVVMSNVPINNFSNHVNGKNDVAFETQTPVPAIGSWSGQRLVNATYTPETKTCSNVACHLRTDVKWGTPYKGDIEEGYACARCHNYGTVCQDFPGAVSRQPSITSTPASLLAAPGYTYTYTVTASEPQGGGITYSLATAPSGMTISSGGTITWTPTAGQLGSAPVTVVASSVASGGALKALQDFTITVVSSPNPVISSTPVTTATAGATYPSTYSYKVVASVPSGAPAITGYTLTTAPTGMIISSGTITWTPTDLQTGDFPVTVRVATASTSTTQSFTVHVDPSPISITSTPVTTATLSQPYSYPVTVTPPPPSGNNYTFSLPTKPTAGSPVMAIGSTTGIITWTPTATQYGSFPVVVNAATSGGYNGKQRFIVTTSQPSISITTTPVLTATAGTAYSYTVKGTLSGSTTGITFALPLKPTGMTIVSTSGTTPSTGVISWTPTAAQKANIYPVSVTATKSGVTTTQSFFITVSP